ncbi:MAG: hypothetical protein M0Z56_06705 [Desulfobacteraceae bacterium]|nr:hypothetical protein [Desulfobacteraceae bacterium]
MNPAIFYNFIEGPLVWLSLAVFLSGIVFQALRLSKMMRPSLNSRKIPEKELPVPKTLTKKERFIRNLFFLKNSILGINPLIVFISLIFHLCILTTPLFVPAHAVLLENFFGFSQISWSPRFAHFLTGLILVCGFFFITRRVIIRRVRAITTTYDYLMLGLALAPFLTGYLAHANVGDYRLMITLHILSGELMLILIPFSKFFHMIFFFFSRFAIVNEYSLGAPKRSWQF